MMGLAAHTGAAVALHDVWQLWRFAHPLTGVVHQFDALQDQQFAGAMMWLPGGFIYTLLAGYYIVQWLNQIEAATQLVEMRRQQHV